MVQSRLRVILAEKGIKQVFIAEKTGISKPTVSAIVNGQQLPTIESALKIAQALGLQVEEIWTLREDEHGKD